MGLMGLTNRTESRVYRSDPLIWSCNCRDGSGTELRAVHEQRSLKITGRAGAAWWKKDQLDQGFPKVSYQWRWLLLDAREGVWPISFLLVPLPLFDPLSALSNSLSLSLQHHYVHDRRLIEFFFTYERQDGSSNGLETERVDVVSSLLDLWICDILVEFYLRRSVLEWGYIKP